MRIGRHPCTPHGGGSLALLFLELSTWHPRKFQSLLGHMTMEDARLLDGQSWCDPSALGRRFVLDGTCLLL